MRVALAASEERLVAYCSSGNAKLIDSRFGEPQLDGLDASLQSDDTVALHIDYSRIEVPDVSGEVTIRVKTPNAAAVIDQINARLGR